MSKSIICEPINAESCGDLYKRYQDSVKNKEPEEDQLLFQSNLSRCMNTLQTHSNFFCRMSDEAPITSSAKIVNGVVIPEDCKWFVESTGCRVDFTPAGTSTWTDFTLRGDLLSKIRVSTEAKNGGSCLYTNEQETVEQDKCSVSCSYEQARLRRQDEYEQLDRDIASSQTSYDYYANTDAWFDYPEFMQNLYKQIEDLKSQKDALVKDDCKLDISTENSNDPKWYREKYRTRISGDPSCPAEIIIRDRCPNVECIYDSNWSDPGMDTCQQDPIDKKWYRIQTTSRVQGAGIACPPIASRRVECEPEPAVCEDNPSTLYQFSSPIFGQNLIKRDCKINVANSPGFCTTLEDGKGYMATRVTTCQGPENGGKSCEQVLKETGMFSNPRILGDIVVDLDGGYYDYKTCQEMYTDYYYNPDYTQTIPRSCGSEGFDLPSYVDTNPYQLSTTNNYQVGTRLSGINMVKSPALYGGSTTCPNQFPTPVYRKLYSSPQQLVSQGVTASGVYWYAPPGFTSPIQLYTQVNMVDNRAWVLVFSSPAGQAATVNHVGKNLPWKGFLIQQQNGANRAHSYFSTAQLFNTRNATTTTTLGTKAGFRVYIGQAGGHGFYNTSQTSPCNWPSCAGSVGAGFNNLNGDTLGCGSFPNGLRWGMGASTTSASYNLSPIGVVWETWIWWD